jgi:ABC-type multidrug transport system fused ATPase/permease subunit
MGKNNEGAIAGLPGLLRRLWRRLSRRRRRQFAAICVLVVVSAFAEVVSVGAVVPFLAVLTSPERVLKYPLIARAMHGVGADTPSRLIVYLAIAFAAAAVIAGALRLLLVWVSTRVAHAAGADLSSEVYRRTLYQPYQTQIMRNSSEVISAVTGKLAETVNVLNQVLWLLSSTVLLIFIMSILFIVDPMVASLAAIGFGGGYAVITAVSRKRLRTSSRRLAEEHTQVVKALQEGLGGIRDVLLDGTQPVYCDLYSRADHAMRRAQGNIVFVSASPRFGMEALGTVLIAALAYGVSRTAGGLAGALPVLGALALGAQRLLPVLQQGYAAWATMAGSHVGLAYTIDLLEQPLPREMLVPVEALQLRDKVHLEDVWFRYSSGAPWVLSNVNLTVPKGTRMGFVGTTLLDVLMGLLAPSQGQLLVDGLPVEGTRVRAWQRAIAHVPQHIFLADNTLAENIAFGVPKSEIDMARVRRAARQAQIAEFIEARAEGYDAVVGERGIRLSGGQRQRVGIARALYKNASVLIFDEATSALDSATEQSVMDAIDGLDRDMTVLLIAHRLTTVRRCDVVVQLENGRVVSQGTYDELLESSAAFRGLAKTVA